MKSDTTCYGPMLECLFEVVDHPNCGGSSEMSMLGCFYRVDMLCTLHAYVQFTQLMYLCEWFCDFCLCVTGKLPFGLAEMEGHVLEDGGSVDQTVPNLSSPGQGSPSAQNPLIDRFSRKVFVGGLPPDIDEGLETSIPLFIFFNLHILSIDNHLHY